MYLAERTTGSWAELSHDSFARDWNNEIDAIYDDWRKYYHGKIKRVRKRKLRYRPDVALDRKELGSP